jgi:pimeloyl-ACP methyl ester carboxylesterase
MLAAIHALGIEHCHLATHSTGGLIALYMLLAEPGRFGRVLALDPVGPRGLRFGAEGRALIAAMRTSRDKTRKGLALTAASLFVPVSLEPGRTPQFAPHASQAQRDLFEQLVDQSRMAADGIWSGIPKHLDDVRDQDGLIERVATIRHPHRVLWGTLDPFIPRRDMDEMAGAMPDCRLEVVAGVGHSMNIERPKLYAQHFAEFF